VVENEVQGEWTLPDGWVWTTLGNVISIRNGFAFKSRDYQDEGVLLIRQSNLGEDGIRLARAVYLPSEYLYKYSDYTVRKGDILIGMSGSVGNTCVYDLDAPGLQNQRTGLIRFHGETHKLYVRYFLDTLKSQLLSQAKGVAVQNISASEIQAFSLPLAPLVEQRRIVAEIETQLTRLDAGVAALERLRTNLKRYRAAVLKAAYDGRLVPTEAALARAEGRAYEPADQLLARILAERRARWEVEHPGKQYREPAPRNTEGLPELPEGWAWATLDVCSDLITKGESPGWQGHKYVEAGVPFVRSENVLWGSLGFSSLVYVSGEFHRKLSRSQLQPSDVLINIVGASIGRCAVVPEDLGQANINQAVALIRCNVSLLPKYVMYLLISPVFQITIQGKKVDVARANISLTDLRQLCVPVAPLAEQHRIIAEVERRLSVVAALEREVEAALARATRLRQAILKRAFEGRLVPQDPNDEPAAVLLERIRAAREAPATGGKKRRTRQMPLPMM